jgi:hypothetical protein
VVLGHPLIVVPGDGTLSVDFRFSSSSLQRQLRWQQQQQLCFLQGHPGDLCRLNQTDRS